MVPSAMIVLSMLAAVVLAPLARECVDLRRSFGLSRLAAVATTALVLPAFAVGLTLSLPLQAWPTLQWLATVSSTLVVYSLATSAIAASASRAATAPSRRI
jgi:hypothetical protein